MRIKRLLEKKQKRNNRLVTYGYFSQEEANKQTKQYARLISRVMGG